MYKHSVPRRVVLKGLASSTGLLLAGCAGSVPPTYGNLLRMGDLLTYKVHRLLLPGQALVREYERSDISNSPAIGTINPGNAAERAFDPEHGPVYERLLKEGFASWRLTVEGSVARPGAFSLADLKRLPSRTQITRHTCEEGWSAINEWTGVPVRTLLEACGIKPSARFVKFYSYDSRLGSVDMLDALHPQTILAYELNDRTLPIPNGAPLRLRVERQLGYKHAKYLMRLELVESFANIRGGKGGYWEDQGYEWWAGI